MTTADIISVVIPCFNAEKWIVETLQSVKNQDGNFQLEIIVVNDGSTDDSEKLIKHNFPEVILKNTDNRGASNARNLGTSISTGKFIQYLDSDDLLAKGKLESQHQILKNSDSDIAYGKWQYYSENADGIFEKSIIFDRKIENPVIDLFTNFWCPPAVYLFRRGIVEKAGKWREDMPVIQDARFALDCALKDAKFTYCDQIMAYYRKNRNKSLSDDHKQFLEDCYLNAIDVESFWSKDGQLTEIQKSALAQNYEFICRASYKFKNDIYNKASVKLKTYGIDKEILKMNVSRKFYLLYRLMGYENALYLNYIAKIMKS